MSLLTNMRTSPRGTLALGMGDLHDPACPWYCGITPWSLATGCISPCSCSADQMWDAATVSCISQQVVAPNKVSGTVVAGEPTLTPCGVNDPGATLAGTDSNGNPIYMCQSTVQQDQANLVQAMSNAANPATPPPVDCTAWYNQIFNSQCGGSMSNILLWGGVLLAAVIIIPEIVRK